MTHGSARVASEDLVAVLAARPVHRNGRGVHAEVQVHAVETRREALVAGVLVRVLHRAGAERPVVPYLVAGRGDPIGRWVAMLMVCRRVPAGWVVRDRWGYCRPCGHRRGWTTAVVRAPRVVSYPSGSLWQGRRRGDVGASSVRGPALLHPAANISAARYTPTA